MVRLLIGHLAIGVNVTFELWVIYRSVIDIIPLVRVWLTKLGRMIIISHFLWGHDIVAGWLYRHRLWNKKGRLVNRGYASRTVVPLLLEEVWHLADPLHRLLILHLGYLRLAVVIKRREIRSIIYLVGYVRGWESWIWRHRGSLLMPTAHNLWCVLESWHIVVRARLPSIFTRYPVDIVSVIAIEDVITIDSLFQLIVVDNSIECVFLILVYVNTYFTCFCPVIQGEVEPTRLAHGTIILVIRESLVLR